LIQTSARDGGPIATANDPRYRLISNPRDENRYRPLVSPIGEQATHPVIEPKTHAESPGILGTHKALVIPKLRDHLHPPPQRWGGVTNNAPWNAVTEGGIQIPYSPLQGRIFGKTDSEIDTDLVDDLQKSLFD
jgi:hypothetical protein